MRHVIFLCGLILSAPAYAEAAGQWTERSWMAPDATSVRDCRRPAEAKEAQVLAFDKASLEAKLAVNLGSDFKIVTIKLWDRQGDARPVIPVVEAARIMQGKLQFYTPNLDADPDPVHESQFLFMATLGGAQLCWATEGALIKDAQSPSKSATATPAEGTKRR